MGTTKALAITFIFSLLFIAGCKKENEEDTVCYYQKFDPVVSLESGSEPFLIDIDNDGIDDIRFYANDNSNFRVWLKSESEGIKFTIGNGQTSGSSVIISAGESLKSDYWIWMGELEARGYINPISFLGLRKIEGDNIYYGWIRVSNGIEAKFEIEEIFYYKIPDGKVYAGEINSTCKSE